MLLAIVCNIYLFLFFDHLGFPNILYLWLVDSLKLLKINVFFFYCFECSSAFNVTVSSFFSLLFYYVTAIKFIKKVQFKLIESKANDMSPHFFFFYFGHFFSLYSFCDSFMPFLQSLYSDHCALYHYAILNGFSSDWLQKKV